MASLNKCSFIGNVGKIETKFMTNGEAVTNLSIAVNETWKDKQGEKQERTEWVNCTVYRKLAEVMQQYVKVGQSLYVEGKMATRKWQDKEGKDRYTTEIIVHDMQMLGGKTEQQDKPGQQAKHPSPAPNSDNFDDENIPF